MEKTYRFFLVSNDSGRHLELETAPIGWDSQKINLIRDLVYFGVFKKISAEYEFVGEAYRFLQQEQLERGWDANVLLLVYRGTKFIMDGKVNYLVASDIRKGNRYKVDIIQSDFIQKFQSRENIKLNVLNNVSLDQKPIAAAELKEALIRGRTIQYKTQFEGISQPNPENYSHLVTGLLKTNGNPNVESAYAVFIHDAQNDAFEEYINSIYGDAANAFYINRSSDLAQTVNLKLNFSYSISNLGATPPVFLFELDDTLTIWGSHYTNHYLKRMSKDGVVQEILFSHSSYNSFTYFSHDVEISTVAQPGDYLVLACERLVGQEFYDDDNHTGIPNEVFYQGGNTGSVDFESNFKIAIQYDSFKMSILQDSTVSDTTCPVVLPFELFSNLIAQINGGIFESEFYGRTDVGYDIDGPGSLLGITVGELLRGIPLEYEENGVVKKLQISTSLRDAFSSYSCVHCLGATIIGNVVKVEPLDNLFSNEISANIGEVADFKNDPAPEFLFNAVKAGYPVNEYEQENGRDEPNTLLQLSNTLGVAKKELNIVSSFYGDGYGLEFARRANVKFTGNSDSRYDGKIFFVDLIKIPDQGSLQSRRLEGILFAEGVFSVETAPNLAITPEQNLLRWKKYLSIAVDRKQDKKYYPQSKEKNSSLRIVTELGETVGGQPIDPEGKPYFIPELRSMDSKLTSVHIEGIIQKPLGRINYTYEGEEFFDYLFEIDYETDRSKGPVRMLGTKPSPVQIREGAVSGNFLKYSDGLQDFLKYGPGENDFLLYK